MRAVRAEPPSRAVKVTVSESEGSYLQYHTASKKKSPSMGNHHPGSDSSIERSEFPAVPREFFLPEAEKVFEDFFLLPTLNHCINHHG